MGAARAINPGLYPNGGNLYLKVTPPGVKSWAFRYTLEGRAHGMGLGPLHTIRSPRPGVAHKPRGNCCSTVLIRCIRVRRRRLVKPRPVLPSGNARSLI
jgi:hypothetical protein